MGLEATTVISGLITSNPTGGDLVSQGDDHIVMIKSVLKNVFPGVGGSGFAIPITATEAELNYVHGVTSAIQTQLGDISSSVSAISNSLGANIQNQTYTAFTTTGTSTAYVATPTPAIATPAANARLRLKFHLASGAAPTLTVGTITAALQQYSSTGALVAATLAANQLTDVEYNGTVYVVLKPLDVPQASSTVSGIIELATDAEVAAGTDTARAVTPAGLFAGLNATGAAPVYACRAWVNFNGVGTVAIRASGNVSSVTDNGVGDYTVNFSTAMPDANYSCHASSGPDISGGAALVTTIGQTGANTYVAPTTTSMRFNTRYCAGNSLSDCVAAYAAIFR